MFFALQFFKAPFETEVKQKALVFTVGEKQLFHTWIRCLVEEYTLTFKPVLYRSS